MSCNELDLVKIGDICDVGSSKRIYASDYTEVVFHFIEVRK